ncbi:MAG: DNA helicase RecQ [Bacteroidota bacterium]
MNVSTPTQPEQLLKKYFGYDQFRGQQAEVISHVSEGNDCLVLMPTGGGKSICYQIPALLKEGVTLVVSPLISLMKDQVDALVANGIDAAFMNSSLSVDQESEIAARCFHGQIKLLYMSPEKVLSTLEHVLKRIPLSLIAIDEAHCVSSWGHDFRPEYKELYKLRAVFPTLPMMALTATADKITRTDILQLLGLRTPRQFVSSFDRPNLSLTVKAGLNKKEKLRDMAAFLDKHPNENGIVYCTSRANTELIAHELTEIGINARAYHAGMGNEERSKVQEDFLNDNIQVVCATIAFGMGIDKSNVRFVMHYNLPKSIESYYQEIGRGGRDGMPCDTILYYALGDLMMLRSFAQQSGQPEINVEKLTRMQEFAEAKHCRRRILLNYFGQQLTENCGNCDVCNHPSTQADGTLLAQKALSALMRIQQIGEQVGSHLLIDVLRGMKHAGITERKLDRIKTYGAGSDVSARIWQSYLLQMIQLGVFEIAYDKGNVLQITSFGESILKGVGKLYLNEPVEIDYTPRRDRRRSDRMMDNMVFEESNVAYGDVPLFEQLRRLRKRIADEEKLPPYVIFHDTTLNDMVEKMPQSESAMLAVSGVSQSKMEKYGQRFLQLLQQQETGVKPGINVAELLAPERLMAYKAELDEKKLRFSAAVVGNVLAGDTSVRYYSIGKQVSFFGVLQGLMSYEEIRRRINPIYEPVEKALKEVRKEQSELSETERLAKLEVVERYFAQPAFNKLAESEWDELKKSVRSLPFQKPTELTSDALKELRKQYFRANEPWPVEELALLEKVFLSCNNLALIMETMGRSEKSILSTVTRFSIPEPF